MFSGFVFLMGVLGVVMNRAMAGISRQGQGRWLLRRVALALVAVLAMLGTACDDLSFSVDINTEDLPRDLIIMSHDSFNISEDVIAEFEAEHDATVTILKSGDAGEALTKAILARDAPTADLLYGIDNTFLGRALDEEIFIEYESPMLDKVPSQYQLDSSNHVMPVDYGFVALNYHIAWFDEQGIAPPTDLRSLTDPQYRGLTVVQNPATSSPGLAFLLATVSAFGEDGDYTWQDYWRDLQENEVLVTDGWTDAYYTAFSLYEGDRPIVVSYTTSPAAEVFYSEGALTEPPTANVLGDNSAFLQIEGIGILDGVRNEELAQQFVDFVMDRRFQEDFPTLMWVYPANEQANLPDVFEYAPIPNDPAELSPGAIAENRERWIDEWTALMRS